MTHEYLVTFHCGAEMALPAAEEWLGERSWATGYGGRSGKIVPFDPALRGAAVVATRPIGVLPCVQATTFGGVLATACLTIETGAVDTSAQYIASGCWLAPLPAGVTLLGAARLEEHMFSLLG